MILKRRKLNLANEKSENDTPIFHTPAIQENSTVFLKTAVASVWSLPQSDDANILFDVLMKEHNDLLLRKN